MEIEINDELLEELAENYIFDKLIEARENKNELGKYNGYLVKSVNDEGYPFNNDHLKNVINRLVKERKIKYVYGIRELRFDQSVIALI